MVFFQSFCVNLIGVWEKYLKLVYFLTVGPLKNALFLLVLCESNRCLEKVPIN